MSTETYMKKKKKHSSVQVLLEWDSLPHSISMKSYFWYLKNKHHETFQIFCRYCDIIKQPIQILYFGLKFYGNVNALLALTEICKTISKYNRKYKHKKAQDPRSFVNSLLKLFSSARICSGHEDFLIYIFTFVTVFTYIL